MNDKARFSLTHYPLPKNAQGKTFFDKGVGYARLRRAFQQTVDDRTVGVLPGDPGVGKTAAIRNLIGELPRPDYQVLYLCNTSARRSICTARSRSRVDIKTMIVHMIDERGVVPVIILDEGHRWRLRSVLSRRSSETRAVTQKRPLSDMPGRSRVGAATSLGAWSMLMPPSPVKKKAMPTTAVASPTPAPTINQLLFESGPEHGSPTVVRP